MNFLPKNLWQQIIRPTNLYFILVCVLQCIPSISITGGKPTMITPLIFVMAVTAFKDFVEDKKKKDSDKMENQTSTTFV